MILTILIVFAWTQNLVERKDQLCLPLVIISGVGSYSVGHIGRQGGGAGINIKYDSDGVVLCLVPIQTVEPEDVLL